ncbi:MAG: hypothetical protein J5704_05470 [Paludibacteraceae bacterium]|nr:hypothetical protein [Paludibacteraceae bacterium]
MESLFESLTGLVAVVCSLGIPIIVILMVYIRKMKRDRQLKEIRQLIIENHTDPETAKLLIDEPKPAKEPRKMGPVNLDTLHAACILLGLGLGAFINWAIEDVGFNLSNIYFWLILAFGIGVGMLVSFLVEMKLYKKYGNGNEKD